MVARPAFGLKAHHYPTSPRLVVRLRCDEVEQIQIAFRAATEQQKAA